MPAKIDRQIWNVGLGGMEKFKPGSGCGDMDYSKEAVGELFASGGDGAVDFQVSEHLLDAVALLVESSLLVDLEASV